MLVSATQEESAPKGRVEMPHFAEACRATENLKGKGPMRTEENKVSNKENVLCKAHGESSGVRETTTSTAGSILRNSVGLLNAVPLRKERCYDKEVPLVKASKGNDRTTKERVCALPRKGEISRVKLLDILRLKSASYIIKATSHLSKLSWPWVSAYFSTENVKIGSSPSHTFSRPPQRQSPIGNTIPSEKSPAVPVSDGPQQKKIKSTTLTEVNFLRRANGSLTATKSPTDRKVERPAKEVTSKRSEIEKDGASTPSGNDGAGKAVLSQKSTTRASSSDGQAIPSIDSAGVVEGKGKMAAKGAGSPKNEQADHAAGPTLTRPKATPRAGNTPDLGQKVKVRTSPQPSGAAVSHATDRISKAKFDVLEKRMHILIVDHSKDLTSRDVRIKRLEGMYKDALHEKSAPESALAFEKKKFASKGMNVIKASKRHTSWNAPNRVSTASASPSHATPIHSEFEKPTHLPEAVRAKEAIDATTEDQPRNATATDFVPVDLSGVRQMLDDLVRDFPTMLRAGVTDFVQNEASIGHNALHVTESIEKAQTALHAKTEENEALAKSLLDVKKERDSGSAAIKELEGQIADLGEKLTEAELGIEQSKLIIVSNENTIRKINGAAASAKHESEHQLRELTVLKARLDAAETRCRECLEEQSHERASNLSSVTNLERQITSLNEKLAEYESNIVGYAQQIVTKENIMNEATAAAKKSEKEKERCLAITRATQAQVNKADARYRAKKSKADSIAAKIAQITEKKETQAILVESLQSQLAAMKEAMDGKEIALSEVTAAAQQAKEEATRVSSEFTAMEARFKSQYRAENDKSELLTTQLNELIKRNESQALLVASLEGQLVVQSSYTEKIRHQEEIIRELSGKIRCQNEQSSSEAGALKTQLEEERQRSVALESQLSAKARDLEELHQAHQSLEAESAALRDKVSNLTALIVESKKELDARNKVVEDLSAAVNLAQGEAHHSDQRLAMIDEESQQSINMLQTKKATLLEQLRFAGHSVESMQTENNALKGQLTQVRSELVAMSNEKTLINSHLNKVTADGETSAQAIVGLQSENQRLTTQLNAAQSQLQAFSQERSEIVTRANEIATDHEAMQQQVNRLLTVEENLKKTLLEERQALQETVVTVMKEKDVEIESYKWAIEETRQQIDVQQKQYATELHQLTDRLKLAERLQKAAEMSQDSLRREKEGDNEAARSKQRELDEFKQENGFLRQECYRLNNLGLQMQDLEVHKLRGEAFQWEKKYSALKMMMEAGGMVAGVGGSSQVEKQKMKAMKDELSRKTEELVSLRAAARCHVSDMAMVRTNLDQLQHELLAMQEELRKTKEEFAKRAEAESDSRIDEELEDAFADV
ncbi:hypothetical protein HK102_006079 [Quaeritorhiza haematococci]|nr:hypothetical protein HK102_006079 [Quaeritorhiza haematococci]